MAGEMTDRDLAMTAIAVFELFLAEKGLTGIVEHNPTEDYFKLEGELTEAFGRLLDD